MPGVRDPYLARRAHIGRLPGAAVAVLAPLIAATARFTARATGPVVTKPRTSASGTGWGTTRRFLRNA